MTTLDAQLIRQDFYDMQNPGEEDEFRFTEALKTLIEATKHPQYMHELAWFYCGRKEFNLEIKYLEMAAECGYGPAFEELGYMWYYGQHGETDYEKAFNYFSKGAEPDRYGNAGDLWCRYKLADMYHFGHFVEKDETKYRELIESAYDDVSKADLGEPYPEIALRLAEIRVEQGRKDEAVAMLKDAKRFLAERLSYDAFWGHIEVMGRIIGLLYRLTPFRKTRAGFYDLFYLTQKPGTITMRRGRDTVTIEVVIEDRKPAISYSGKWYRCFEEFCQKATLGGQRFTEIYDEIYDIRRQ